MQTPEQRIAEIQQRVEKATEGPWAWESTGEKSNDYAIGTAWGPDGKPVSGRIVSGDDPESGVWLEDTIIRRHLIGEGENGRFADAEFIAHAREDIPYLLAALAAERAAREKAEQEIADAREACPIVRRQDYFDAPLITLIEQEISQLFMWQSRAEAAEARATKAEAEARDALKQKAQTQ